MKNTIKDELEKIEIPKELHSRALLGVEKAKAEMSNTEPVIMIEKRKKKMGLGRKMILTGTAAVMACGLFVGSAFVSPAMAAVASKIPYLKNIFEMEDVNKVIWDTLEEKGYQLQTMGGIPSQNREFEVYIQGNEQYVQEVKGDIQKTVSAIIKQRDYDPHKIIVKAYKQPNLSKEDQERQDRNQEFLPVAKELETKLKKQGYNILAVAGQPVEKQLYIAIPVTEKQVDEIKKAANEILDGKGYEPFEIQVDMIDKEKDILESDRSSLYRVIWDGLVSKKEFKVKEIREYNYENQLDIITTVKSSDKDAKEVAETIEVMINELLKSEKASALLHDKPLIVNIYSLDKQKLN